jgi:hypothetical protein
MRKVHSGLILGIVRKTKLYLGLICALCVILLINGYFRQKEYFENSPISLHDDFENLIVFVKEVWLGASGFDIRVSPKKFQQGPCSSFFDTNNNRFWESFLRKCILVLVMI